MTFSASDIEDLQSRMAFQEDEISKLNTVVARQDAEIQSLQQQLQVLYKKVVDLKSEFEQTDGSHEPPPPHY